MRFKTIHISNFLSYGKSQKVDLYKKGLVGVFGFNKDSSYDSNGSGKSTIFEAIVWNIWGTTIRGLKSDEVVNNKTKKNCKVILELEDGDKTYKIERTRKNLKEKKHNDLLLLVNGSDVTAGTMNETQRVIDSIVGMSFHTFTQSVLLINDLKSFCTLTDDKKKEVLEDILQINVFRKSRDLVRSKIIIKEKELAVLNSELSLKNSDLENLDKDIEDHERQKNIFSKQVRQDKDSINLKIKETKVRYNEAKKGLKKLKEHQKTRDTLKAHVLKLKENFGDFSRQEKDIEVETQNGRELVISKKSSIQENIKIIRENYEQMSSLAGKTCHTCKQQVDPMMAESLMNEYEVNIKKREEELSKLDKVLQGVETKRTKVLSEIEEKREKIRIEADKFQKEINTLDNKIEKLMGSSSPELVNMLDDSLVDLRLRLEKVQNTDNPYDALIDNLRDKKVALREERRKLKIRSKLVIENLRKLRFWDSGFGNQGIKSMVMENVVPFLNSRAQYYADLLSEGKLNIEFSTKVEQKNGKFKEKIDVKVTNSSGADVYTGNSSGERRRGDIAVGWALADLAATRASKPIKFRGLDEPFESLDESGVEAVFNLLNNVIPNYETIFCITHKPELGNRFQQEMYVTKEDGITKVSQV